MVDNLKGCILAVDDEVFALEMFEDSFRREYKVLLAHNGEEALQLIKDNDIQLIFSDQRMPGISGIELLERVKDEKPDVVRILTTGVTDLQTAIDSINRGNIHRYIPKPWNEDELRKVIVEQLHIRALDEENKRLQANYEKEKLKAAIKEEILQTVSHEFRTPLKTITGYMELFARQHFGTLNQRQQEIVDVVFESGLYLNQMLENTLLLSKLKSGVLPLCLEDLVLGDVLEEVISSMTSMAQKKKLNIVLMCDHNYSQLGDRSKLKIIFYNLIHNGIKFTTSGSITLVVEPNDKNVKVCVIDTGKGITIEEQEMIFHHFRQTNEEETGLQGLGLGLSIADGLVRLHGGSLTVESILGEGSTFTVDLPLLPGG